MAAPSPIKEILLAIGEAIRAEMIRLADSNGKYPLRDNSKLKRTLRVEVTQGRAASGRFEGYTANAQLQLYAQDYAQWLDRGRKPHTKKVPIAALLQFIKDRRLRWKHKKTGRFLTANTMAFLIQSAIYKRGIRGRNFIQPAYDVGENLVDIYLNNQLLDGLTYELDRQLQVI
ncbi:hypothetical protein [Hymenobacter fodinae]|uniref:Phage virion morphogenesis protein n=1 Tax=Hymenobacter fodinae TaxID=2510796 RepID=A0A4Z0P7J0_9BACT|nr:hypothetical protein [Hymenobacter fodinae]TGE08261.1 hypothetical protein EU556_11100 [Hymenobacter fodinae]